METPNMVRNFDPEDKSLPKVWTAKVCPFAERFAIGLNELGVQFEAVQVDLKNKPASLFEVNSKGLVPAMKDQGHCISDSYILLQYIDEMWSKGDRSLLPKTPVERAIARTWCEFINKNVVPPFYQILFKESSEDREQAKSNLLDAIKIFSKEMQNNSSGPFFFGEKFSMVDIMLAPHVERFVALKHFRGFEVPEEEEFKRFHVWWRSVQERPSFQPTRVDLPFLVKAFTPYLKNSAQSTDA